MEFLFDINNLQRWYQVFISNTNDYFNLECSPMAQETGVQPEAGL